MANELQEELIRQKIVSEKLKQKLCEVLIKATEAMVKKEGLT